MHLQRVQGADLKVRVVVQELLHDRFEGQQQLLLLIQLFFGGGRQLVLSIQFAHLMGDVLEEAEEQGNESRATGDGLTSWK